MDRPDDSQKPPKASEQKRPNPSNPKTAYLILYNSISALLWTVVLGRVLLIASLHGYQSVFAGTANFTRWTQTLAGLEVVHAAIGLVRAPLFTTLMQVSSRFLLVWFIAYPFPATTSLSPAYSSMLVAWSITEVIRYSYFALNLLYGRVPSFLIWLRYNTFFVLYPMGISSECWLVWKAIEPAKSYNLAYQWVLRGILFVYVPGAWILYTHMMKQRRKVLRVAGEDKKKA
ncbi:putative very-long-chain (3R)-3-hydroxyacyl-CoA dehydratase, partial [Pseudocercospora fuligena]